MAVLTYFSVVGAYYASLVDSYDVDTDPDLVPLFGRIRFTPLIDAGDVVKAQTLTPPTNLLLKPVEAQVKAGVVWRNGSEGVKLVANTAVLELAGALYYQVDFPDGLTARGTQYQVDSFPFLAPTTAVTIDLSEVTPMPGQPATGPVPTSAVLTINGRTGYVILGPSDINTAIALDQAATWTALGTVPSGNLPSYVDDVLEYVNLAAFPGTGETGKIYVAIDTGDSYRWSGSTYVRVSDRITASGITDSTATGRAVVTGDAAAARTALDFQRLQTLRAGASVWSNLVDDTHIHSGNRVAALDRPVSVSAPTVVTAGATNLLNALLPWAGGTPGTPGTMPTGISKQTAGAAKNLNAYTDDSLDITFVAASGLLVSGGIYFFTFPSNGNYLLSFTVECVSTTSATNRVRVSTWNTNTNAVGDLRNVVYRTDDLTPRRVVSRITVTDFANEHVFISVDDLATVDATSRFVFSDFMLTSLADTYAKYGTLLQATPYGQESTPASDIAINVPAGGDHMVVVKTVERGWIAERATLTATSTNLSALLPGISFTAQEVALIPAAAWQVGDLDVIRPPEWKSVRYHDGASYVLSYPRSWADLSEMIGDALTSGTVQTLDRPYATAVALERNTLHRFEVRTGDHWIADTEAGSTNQRVEVGNGYNLPWNTDVWTSFWVKFGGDGLDDFCVIQQELAFDAVALSPAFSIGAWPDNVVKITYRTDGGTPAASMADVTSTNTPETVTWTPGKWHRCVVRTNHSPSGAGSFSWWWDGALMVSNRGPMGYNTTSGPKAKHGLYRGNQSNTFIATFQHFEVSTTSLLSRVTAPLPI